MIRVPRAALTAFIVISPVTLRAQAASSAVPAPIRDNSFLIEEAYNQEAGVVQHISVLLHDRRSGLWSYNFTQEWPLKGFRNQLSYTIPFANAGGRGYRGIGDVALNYRLQAAGPEGRVSFAPRVSLILPTGNVERGLGRGGTGFQTNLPLSVDLAPWLVSHTNVGATLVTRAKGAGGARASLVDFNVGQSLIWLTTPTINVMVESTMQTWEEVVGPDRATRRESFYVSPAIRYAINFKSGLQIVPGIAIPFEFGPDRGEPVILAYLSFEHPF